MTNEDDRHLDWNLRRFPHEELEKRLGCGGRRGRILSGDETAIDYRMALPILPFLVKAANPFHLILTQEWHSLGEIDPSLFTPRQPAHPLPFHPHTPLLHLTIDH